MCSTSECDVPEQEDLYKKKRTKKSKTCLEYLLEIDFIAHTFLLGRQTAGEFRQSLGFNVAPIFYATFSSCVDVHRRK